MISCPICNTKIPAPEKNQNPGGDTAVATFFDDCTEWDDGPVSLYLCQNCGFGFYAVPKDIEKAKRKLARMLRP